MGANQCPGVLHVGVLWQVGWNQSRYELGGPRVLCANRALTSCLKQKWCRPSMFHGTLYLYHLGTTARVVVTTNQGCPGIYCTGAALVGQLWLEWISDPWLIEVAGHLGHLDPAPGHSINVEGKQKPWHSPASLTQSSF